MIRCIIIDDEPLALNILETYIQRVSYLSLVAKCSSITKCENEVDAYDLLLNQSIDLIFCDIEMPGITGIEFIKSLKNIPCVIFTTAYWEYALEGFNLDVVDYLLKPVSFDRFLKAVNKAKSILNQQPTQNIHDHLFVKEDYKLVKINHTDIFYIEAMKDYVKIYTTDKTIVTHITMKRLEETLPADKFYRTHKSYIVKFDAIKSIDGNVIELINNSKVRMASNTGRV